MIHSESLHVYDTQTHQYLIKIGMFQLHPERFYFFVFLSDMKFWNCSSRMSAHVLMGRNFAWNSALLNLMLQRNINSFSALPFEYVLLLERVASAAVVQCTISGFTSLLCSKTALPVYGKALLTVPESNFFSVATKPLQRVYWSSRWKAVAFSIDRDSWFVSPLL